VLPALDTSRLRATWLADTARPLAADWTDVETWSRPPRHGTSGCASPVFGTDKTAGTMDALQRAAEAADLDEWEMSLR
jgi:hypothetical protein